MDQQIERRGGKRPGSGRPKGSTTGRVRKMRSFRLNDEEYELVKEFINKIKNDPANE